MLLLNALSDKSQLRPISVILCADNVGEDGVRLAGRARLANTVIFILILYYYRHRRKYRGAY